MLVVSLALPGQALAQSPTNDQYDDSSITVVGDPGNPVCDPGEDPACEAAGSEAVRTTDSGSLPFSGFDAGLLAAAGGALVLLGVGMRRMTRRPAV